ncbi:exocyst complex component 3-like protein 4 [Tiliqua scincoides]|uniref:exocyst complex component 3-like protein 4 n=1 Tax=Tiliqua scincoides TaxID=71010 RepID=UPI003462533B
MNENREANGKTASTSEPESLEKCNEKEDDSCLPNLDSSPLSDGGEENKANSFIRGIKTTLSFRRGRSESMKMKPTKGPAFTRSRNRFSLREETDKSTGEKAFDRASKRFSLPKFSLPKFRDGNHAGRANSSVPEESEESGKGQDCVKKEPLSVMQINELIEKRQLLEAFENIKDLEMELLAERESKKHEDNSQEFTVRAKDVDLLYASVSKKIQDTVEETLTLPKVDAKALTSLVSLIEEEGEAHAEAAKVAASSQPLSRLGSARNWRELWKESVQESVKKRVLKVPIPLKEGNSAWLSIHLGYFKTVIKEDLLTIKLWVQKCYPSDYNVFDTYLTAFHRALSLHLQNILKDDSLKYHQHHAVLKWVTNVYRSDDFLGHPDLKPEIKMEDLPDLLTPEVLEKLKNDYIHSVKLQIKNCLDNILNLETKEKWNSEEQPESVPDQCCSSLSLDIQTIIGEYTKVSGNICKNLEMEVLKISLQEVKEFILRFGNAFLECSKVKDRPRFVPLMVAYINNFHDLKMGLQTNFNANCKDLEILNGLILRYKKCFFNQLKLETQPMFKKIRSRAWVLSSESPESFIKKILLVIEDFSKHLIHLKEPFHKDFLNEAHRFVIKAYITQILKPGSRMRKTKRREVSKIMDKEAATIDQAMTVLGSSSEWLSLAIPYIAKILGEKKKHVIKDHIKDLCRDYPDIGKEHIIAILALRGLRRSKREFTADHMDKPSESNSDKRLFAEIELPNTIQC